MLLSTRTAAGRAPTRPASLLAPLRAGLDRLNIPLRFRLILLVVACLTPLLGLGLLELHHDYRKNVQDTAEANLRHARSIAAVVDNEFQRHATAVQVLARTPLLRHGNLDGFRRLAEATIAEQFPGATISLQLPDGRQLLNTAAPWSWELPSRGDLSSIDRMMRTGRPAVADIRFDPILQRPVLSIDVPVRDDAGNITAVLAIIPASEALNELIGRHRPPDQWTVSVFDRNGLAAARVPADGVAPPREAGPALLQALLNQSRGVLETTAPDGAALLTVFARSETFGWPVAIAVPQAVLAGPALADARDAALIGAFCVALSVALALLVARWIAQPFAALRRMANAYEQDVPYTPRRTGLPEADHVALAFRLAQQRRRLSDQRYRTLFDTNPLSMCVFDLESLRFLNVNDTMVAQYGWSRPQFLDMTVFDVHPPEAHDVLRRVIAERRRDYTIAQWRRDGTRFDAETIVRTIDLAGRKVGMAIARDVTRERLMRDQLREAIQAFPGAFRIYDREERLVLKNDRSWMPDDRPATVWVGDTIEQTVRVAAAIEATEDSIGRPEAWVRERLAQFRRADANCEVRTRDGRWHQLLERRTADGGTISVRLDITERKAIEAQLRQAQKMETIGQLAGGVAHDFNNSLAVIMASLENLLDVEPETSEARGCAETALKATEQAASLTRRLLAFARRQDLAPVEIDAGAAVRDLHKILRSSVPRAIDVAVEADAGPTPCVLDRTQLETAVMNMVVNARDAIDGRTGHITVTVEQRRYDAAQAAQRPGTREGDWVVVSVRDDGPGMTPQIQARIFEPFFTTKGAGKGTGLGLSQIHGFVAQSRGFVQVCSAPGEGTCIALHFPAKAPVDDAPRAEAALA
ncbi:MAG: ATP-binding protein [Reyranellaceae bacterium]